MVNATPNSTLLLFPPKSPMRWRYLYGETIKKQIGVGSSDEEFRPLSSVPVETRRWIRNATDERAAQTLVNGKPIFRMSEKLGQSVVDWVSTHCYLYEGPMAGQPMIVEDWQYEFFMQMFGWCYYHPEFKKWVRRFREASVWIPKKNAKSPTLAAAGLYVFCGEGEQGQKCYSVARDGEQAKISHTHAVHMVEQSPTLSRECKIYRNTWDIIHIPTNSRYGIVNAKNATSQEGLNGSIFVDETHVVGNDIMEIIRRAGISRMQPVQLEFSTAGDISNQYGKSRFDQGVLMEKCATDEDFNPRLLFMNFSIHQDISPREHATAQSVMKLAVKTNPAIGRLFTREDILNDWQSSRRSPHMEAQFLRYRLGKWVQVGANWLGSGAWEQCKHEGNLTLSKLKPYPCAVGVDLSSTRDTTSVVLLFGVPRQGDPSDIVPYIASFFWLPQPSIQRYKNQIDLTVFKNHLTFTPDEAVDHTVIADFITELRDQGFDIRGVGFDPFHSRIWLDRMIKVHGWNQLHLRTIPTSIRQLSPSTKDIEALVLNHNLVHDGNPVMTWQFSNAQVLEDRMGNYMPCKPGVQRAKGGGTDDCRKVDGIIALVNAAAVSTDTDIGFRSVAEFTTTNSTS